MNYEHPDYYINDVELECEKCSKTTHAFDDIQEQIQALFYQLYVTNISDPGQIANIFYKLEDYIDVEGKYKKNEKYIYNLHFENCLIS